MEKETQNEIRKIDKRKIDEKTKIELGKLEGDYYIAQVEVRNGNYDAMKKETDARKALVEFISSNTDIRYNQIVEKIERLEDKIKDAWLLGDRERNEVTSMYNIKIAELLEKLKVL
jgi:hypothetical protein